MFIGGFFFPKHITPKKAKSSNIIINRSIESFSYFSKRVHVPEKGQLKKKQMQKCYPLLVVYQYTGNILLEKELISDRMKITVISALPMKNRNQIKGLLSCLFQALFHAFSKQKHHSATCQHLQENLPVHLKTEHLMKSYSPVDI